MGDDVHADLRERMATSDFHRWMGIRLLEAGDGFVEVALDVEDRHRNLQGLVHGGVLATLADTAAGLAIRTRLSPGRRHVTVNLDVQYLSAGGPGTIVARGTVVRVGRQIAHAESRIHDGRGKLLATAHATVAVMTDRRG